MICPMLLTHKPEISFCSCKETLGSSLEGAQCQVWM
uniref:Uncharacterized protein n=1 Tax=Anguilla anguilla TaxID=7936 RepID=A0A0E9SW16_ANGAN